MLTFFRVKNPVLFYSSSSLLCRSVLQLNKHQNIGRYSVLLLFNMQKRYFNTIQTACTRNLVRNFLHSPDCCHHYCHLFLLCLQINHNIISHFLLLIIIHPFTGSDIRAISVHWGLKSLILDSAYLVQSRLKVCYVFTRCTQYSQQSFH